MKSYVYLILDQQSRAVKIGKSNDINSRMIELQTGNPNELKLIRYIECSTEEQAIYLENTLHIKYKDLQRKGEWFNFNLEMLNDFETGNIKIERKKVRDNIQVNSLWEDESFEYGLEIFPICFFYPDKPASILTSYEKALKIKKRASQWRTMDYPTNGKCMLRLPDGTLLSDEVDKVFISSKKHKENLELKNFLEQINSVGNDLKKYI
jgi:hypothetical protein